MNHLYKTSSSRVAGDADADTNSSTPRLVVPNAALSQQLIRATEEPTVLRWASAATTVPGNRKQTCLLSYRILGVLFMLLATTIAEVLAIVISRKGNAAGSLPSAILLGVLHHHQQLPSLRRRNNCCTTR